MAVLLCVVLGAVAISGLVALVPAIFEEVRARSVTIKFDDASVEAGRLTVETTKFAPDLLQRISAEEAIRVNAERPVTSLPIPSASPFVLGSADRLSRARAVDCLTAAIYYEGASEPHDGQLAIAQVVLNRVRLPLYPHSVCEVVFQGSTLATGCQFSFTCDGSMRRVPSVVGWRRARSVAEAALSGRVSSQVGWATHYHADYVTPYWAPELVKLKSIGRHIFYGWPGYWNRAAAFNQAYAGVEHGLPADAVEGATNGPLQIADSDLSTARVIPVNERPVIFGEPAKATSAGVAATEALKNRRWVLVTPDEADPSDTAQPTL